MNTITPCLIISSLLLVVGCSPKSGNEPTNETEIVSESNQPINGSFAHVVFFWLKNPNSADDRQKFVTSLTNFINNSAFVKTKHIGTPADTDRPVIDNTYTYSLILTFDSKADQDKYQEEDVHLKFIEESQNLWEKVLVYDSQSLD